MDRHCLDADPDTTFHFDAYPDPAPNFTHHEKSELFLLLFKAARLHCFIFLVSVIVIIIFNILDSILKLSEKMIS